VVQTKNLPKSVIVTGGSGYIGHHLVTLLSRLGVGVFSTYRTRVDVSKPYGVVPVYLDLKAQDKVSQALGYADVVVHLAWENGLGDGGANLLATSNLLGHMETLKIPRIVFLSSLKASKQATTAFLKEKYEAESLIVNSSVPEKIILRSSSVFGGEREGEFLRLVQSMIRSSFFYPVPDIDSCVNPVHVNDLDRLLISLITSELDEACIILDFVGRKSYGLSDLFDFVSRFRLNGKRIPIKSFLGDSIIKFYTRKDPLDAQRLRDHLLIGSQINSNTRTNNPLAGCIPKKLASFEDCLKESNYPGGSSCKA